VSVALPQLSIPSWGATAVSVVAALIPAAQLLIPKVTVVAELGSIMQKHLAYITIVLSYILGGGSMIAFAILLYAGHLDLVNLHLDETHALLLNAGLSLAFFIQHSGMVRKSFSQFLSRFLPDAYNGVLYSIASGIFLFLVVLFWQGTSSLFEAEGIIRIFMRIFFILPIAGFVWGVKTLGFFDPFGIRGVLTYPRGRKSRLVAFTARGPYQWVRHPLYLFMLMMIWSCPNLTKDRLLFNILWSVWIFVGTILEERDLVKQFGDVYREYQQKVPMLFPLKFIKAKLL
jgi:protein-S-isoprenylcysteine O-methyltransferase Ste14